MNNLAKYSFDTSFAPDDLAAEELARAQAAAAPTYSEEEMAAARERAYGEGMAAGVAQARAGIEQAAAEALDGICRQLGELGQAHERAMAQMRLDATELALLVARKLAPALIDREPLVEIEALIKECLAGLRDEPRVVVRATEPIVEALKSRVDGLAAECGFPGQIVLLVDETLNGSDCRIEWADGGAERDSAALDNRIEAALRRYLERETSRRDMASEPAAEPTPGDARPRVADDETAETPDGEAGAAGTAVEETGPTTT